MSYRDLLYDRDSRHYDRRDDHRDRHDRNYSGESRSSRDHDDRRLDDRRLYDPRGRDSIRDHDEHTSSNSTRDANGRHMYRPDSSSLTPSTNSPVKPPRADWEGSRRESLKRPAESEETAPTVNGNGKSQKARRDDGAAEIARLEALLKERDERLQRLENQQVILQNSVASLLGSNKSVNHTTNSVNTSSSFSSESIINDALAKFKEHYDRNVIGPFALGVDQRLGQLVEVISNMDQKYTAKQSLQDEENERLTKEVSRLTGVVEEMQGTLEKQSSHARPVQPSRSSSGPMVTRSPQSTSTGSKVLDLDNIDAKVIKEFNMARPLDKYIIISSSVILAVAKLRRLVLTLKQLRTAIVKCLMHYRNPALLNGDIDPFVRCEEEIVTLYKAHATVMMGGVRVEFIDPGLPEDNDHVINHGLVEYEKVVVVISVRGVNVIIGEYMERLIQKLLNATPKGYIVFPKVGKDLFAWTTDNLDRIIQ